MKVKMKTLGANATGILRIGEVVEVSAEEGRQLVEGGYAEEMPETPEETKGAEQPTENPEQGQEVEVAGRGKKKRGGK